MMMLSYLFEVLLIECESAETVGMTVLDVWNCFDNDRGVLQWYTLRLECLEQALELSIGYSEKSLRLIYLHLFKRIYTKF